MIMRLLKKKDNVEEKEKPRKPQKKKEERKILTAEGWKRMMLHKYRKKP